MAFDPVVSLRIINNQRLMRATHRGEYRDLGGALAITSDAAHLQWNCIEGFTTDEARIEGLLDIGFSLLRAFDRLPAARVTPLDRPASVAQRLQRRGLAQTTVDVSMTYAPTSPPAHDDAIVVRRADPEDAGDIATIQSQAFPSSRWMRPFLLGAALANIIEPDHAFYLAYDGGEPCAAALSIREERTAGIYSVATLRAHRNRGLATALVARAVTDAFAAGADCICLEAERGSDARRLFEKLGFTAAHESTTFG